MAAMSQEPVRAEPRLNFFNPLVIVAALSLVPMTWYYVMCFRITGWPMEVSNYPSFRDFTNIWAAARAALSGDYGILYDPLRHIQELARLIDPRVADNGPILFWSYPPTAIWLGLPFAGLPYPLAPILWSILGVFAAVAAVGVVEQKRPSIATMLIILLTAPGVILCLLFGQTALVTSAILLAGLALVERRPVLAGALLAFLVVKPHLGLAIPVFLLALRARRAFFSTAGFGLIYLALTVLAFGFEPWRLFFSVTLPYQLEVVLMSGVFNIEMMISPFFLFRRLTIPAELALTMHWIVAAVVLGCLYAALRRISDMRVRIALTAIATLLVSPYMQSYELALSAIVAILLARHADAVPAEHRLQFNIVVVVLGLIPVLGILGTEFLRMNPSALILCWCGFMITILASQPRAVTFDTRFSARVPA